MRVLVVGAGYVGSLLAAKLSEAGHSVTVVDKDEERVAKLAQSRYDVEAYARDATDPSFYEEIQVESYDVVVAVTDKDEVNVFVALLARMRGVDRVYVRARNPETARMLEMLGIRGVILEPQLAANVLYSLIEGSHTIVSIAPSFTGDYVVAGLLVKPASPLRGRRVEDALDEIQRLGGRLLAVYEGSNFYEPDEIQYINDGMVLIILARPSTLKDLAKLV